MRKYNMDLLTFKFYCGKMLKVFVLGSGKMAEKVVDIHAHAFDEKIAVKATENLHKYYDIEPVSDGRLRHLIRSAEENNIDKLVVCATATKVTQVTMINDYVSGLISDRIISFGTLHPDFDGIDEEIKRMKELNLSGIKFHPIFQGFKIDDEMPMRMFEKIGDSFPVLIHVGDKNSDWSTPKRLRNVMNELPNVTFIAAHLGGVFEWESAKKYLIGENVYIDTSSSVRFLPPREAKAIIRQHGADKVLFGTDYPLSNHKFEFECLKKEKLKKDEYEKIYWQNAYKLLNLK